VAVGENLSPQRQRAQRTLKTISPPRHQVTMKKLKTFSGVPLALYEYFFAVLGVFVPWW
jgi:hypothetical protein